MSKGKTKNSKGEKRKMLIDIREIKINGGTQTRARLDKQVINEYAEALENGAEFPKIVIFNDGENYWLADGFHRYHAHIKAGMEAIDAEVKQGTRRDAILYSVGANSQHGLKRTNDDKRRAVITMLQDEEWKAWSDREISRQCNVSNVFVGKVREDMANGDESAERTYKRNGKEQKMNTDNIGKEKKEKTEDPELARLRAENARLKVENQKLQDDLRKEKFTNMFKSVNGGATTNADEIINRYYKMLTKAYHPDLTQDAAEKARRNRAMAEINQLKTQYEKSRK
jgi:hypothetical protein